MLCKTGRRVLPVPRGLATLDRGSSHRPGRAHGAGGRVSLQGGFMRRLLVLLSLLGALSAAATALARPQPSPPVRSDGLLGIVPSHLVGPQAGFGNLSYHGGPV